MTILLEVFTETVSLVDISPLESLYYMELRRSFRLFPEIVKLRCVLTTGEYIFTETVNLVKYHSNKAPTFYEAQ
jgi:hypothetical protein